jgi:hypothetical protein
MSILTNKFQVRSHDCHPNAQAALMVVFAIEGHVGPYASLPASGTPPLGVIFPGAIVVMNANGNIELGDNDDPLTHVPSLLYTAVDGDQDYDGAFVGKVTCLQGGMELELDTGNYVAASYAKGEKLTVGHAGGSSKGQFRAAASTEQIYAVVGARGLDAATDILHVIVPAGICPALP